MSRRVLGLVAIVLLFFGARAIVHRVHDRRQAQLVGLWKAPGGAGPSADLRFYYFHTGGKGLYRYGKVAYNQTHSFDWSVDGDRLTLLFRKRGQTAVTRFVIGGDEDARTLTLVDDPRNEGRTTYDYTPSSLTEDVGPLSIANEDHAATSAVQGRMWLEHARYATGGAGFHLYQLSVHDVREGWKLGWFHVGDSDDWTTETLVYRLEPGALHLRFVLRGEDAVAPYTLGQERDRRTLTLPQDPRNFGARTRFFDAGRSF